MFIKNKVIFLLLVVVSVSVFLSSSGFGAVVQPDNMFFAPSSMVPGVYPIQAMTGDGETTPWNIIWTYADIQTIDPGRIDITFTGIEVLPVLVENLSPSVEGEYSEADLAAINLTNYRNFYLQQPGTDIFDPNTDYVADVENNQVVLSITAPALYAVRIKTQSRSGAGQPLEDINYIYTQFVNDFFAEDGVRDNASVERRGNLEPADLYVVSKNDPNDNGFLKNAVDNLTDQGRNVCEADNLAASVQCICDESRRLGRKINVTLIGHGRPGSIKIGTERINEDHDSINTPLQFQERIDECVSNITFFSCNTMAGQNGQKFLNDFATSINMVGGWRETVTSAKKSTFLGFKIRDGYFNVEAKSKKEKKGVDLIVSAFTPPANAATGTSISVPNTVTNQGTWISTASYIRFYLSTDATCTTSDTYLGQRYVGTLAAGASSSATTAIPIPVVTHGNYYICAIADATNTNLESNETNNTALSAISSITSGIDFIVSTFTSPANATVGTSISVSTTVMNQGIGRSTATYVKFYLSTDAICTTSDTNLLPWRYVSPLDGGRSSSATTTIKIAAIPAGSYYICAIVDAYNGIPESNENNNTASNLITIADGIDLFVSWFNPPVSALTGTSVSVPNTVRNQGTGPSNASYIRFYLSIDANITTSDQYLGQRYIGLLGAGALSSATTTVKIPVVAAGSYYIGAIADATNTNSETNEGNNTASRAISITSGIDLIVSAFTPPASAATGTSISVPNTVKNQGTGISNASYIRFYLSTDATITTSDTYLSQRYIGLLGAGALSSATTSIKIPVVAAGSYYIGAIADATNTNPETNETNNTASSAISLTSGIDLIVSAFTPPPTAIRGMNISVPNTVKNQGTGTSKASYIHFYLSNSTSCTELNYLGHRYVGLLGANVSSSATTSLSIPATIATGSYYMCAFADRTDTNQESDETNNTASSAITIN